MSKLKSEKHCREIKSTENSALEAVMAKIIQLIYSKYKVNFNNYKLSTLKRRVRRRISSLELSTPEQYAELLNRKPDEIEGLYRDFLIGVTSFFRDPEAFDQLKHDILPALLKLAEKESRELRVWVPACSTGEEVYTIAMLLSEEADKQNTFLNAKIFASDINSENISIASDGLYSEESVKKIPQQYLSKYFSKVGKRYKVNKNLRSLVVFAPYNVITDPPFTRVDLITCRNFLIYVKAETQRRVIDSLCFGLKVGGYLLLGPSESVGNKHEAFKQLDNKWKLYKKIRQTHPEKAHLPTIGGPVPAQQSLNSTVANIIEKTVSFPLYAYHEIIKQIIQLGFILDENRKVVHTFGAIKSLLHVPEGVVDGDILNMIHADLKVPLNTGLYRAKKAQEAVRYANVNIAENGNNTLYDLIVLPIFNQQRQATYYLVRLEDKVECNQVEEEGNFSFDIDSQQIIKELENELHESRELLQSTMEEIESTNEELQSTNEELLASNEELQSTNEELHSANAELNSVNHEYQIKLDELTSLDNDVNNLLRSIEVGTIFVDENKALKLFTPATQQYFNILPKDIGRQITHFSHELKDFAIAKIFKWVVSNRKRYEKEIQTNDGLWLLLRAAPAISANDKLTGVIYTFTDITKAKKSELRLDQLANYDSLTTLPSRGNFLKKLTKYIKQASKAPTNIAVLFIDLDNFKQINDCLGHDAGDRLLKKVSGVMQSILEGEHYMARIGGDEFAIIAKNTRHKTDIANLANKLIQAFNEPIKLYDWREVKTSISIGISTYPEGGTTVDDLIRHADMAMYQAKKDGKDSFCFFDEILKQRVTNHHLIETYLHHAQDKKELSVVFQPQIDSNGQHLIGVEALVRWNCDKLGEINPQEFIHIAEESKLIVDIGAWIINSACNEFVKFTNKINKHIQLSINISSKQLMMPNFVSFMKETLVKHTISPNQIILEITESTLILNDSIISKTMQALCELGISFALDDFGIGYSSMQYIKTLPIRYLKIDKTFIKRIASNKADYAIVSSIVALGKGLNMKVIAEGVETEGQVETLNRCGCTLMQGFLFGVPGPINDVLISGY